MAGDKQAGAIPVRAAPDSRVVWVDTARGLGIMLVVYGHVARSVVLSGLSPGDAAHAIDDSIIYAFHMPLFFFISGLVTRRPERGARMSFIHDRVSRIAYPYLVWTIIFVLAGMVAGDAANKEVGWPDLTMMGYVPVAHFWFLYVLFFCSMVMLVPGMRAIMAITIVGMIATLWIGMGRMPERTAYFLPFFVAGVALTMPRAAAFLADARRASAVAVAGWILFLITFAFSPMEAQGANVPVFLISRWVTGFAGCVGTLAIARLIGARMPLLCALGRVSMPIYLMSPMASAAVRVLLVRLGIVMPEAAWLAILTLAGLALPWLAYSVLHAIGLAGVAGLDKARRPVRLGAGSTASLEAAPTR